MRAADRASALDVLRERSLIATDLRATSLAAGFGRIFRRTPASERLAFFRAYAALESAGVDFSTAFELLIAQARRPHFREALTSVRNDVERGGERLHAAMAHRPDDFTDLEVAMVNAGEEAGNREEIFDRLAGFLERDQRLRKRLKGALFYPAVVIVAACCICVYLFAFVIPQFAGLFTEFGIPPSPLMTSLVAIDRFVARPFSMIAIVGMTTAVVLGALRLASTPAGAEFFDRLRLRIPVLGAALRKGMTARVARILSTLLESGVHQVRALEVATPVAESPVFASALEKARERLVGGASASLEEAFAASDAFEPLLIGFVRVGAQAGTIPQMLVKVAEYYEDDVEMIVSAVPALVQTSVTIALGFVVALILYVVYVPLSSLASSIH
jgi:type IV pilus assembly protein PilC